MKQLEISKQHLENNRSRNVCGKKNKYSKIKGSNSAKQLCKYNHFQYMRGLKHVAGENINFVPENFFCYWHDKKKEFIFKVSKFGKKISPFVQFIHWMDFHTRDSNWVVFGSFSIKRVNPFPGSSLVSKYCLLNLKLTLSLRRFQIVNFYNKI